MSAKQFQEELHELAFRLGEEQELLFAECFGTDWPDEESTTGNLFGALVSSIRNAPKKFTKQDRTGVVLKATFTRKRDEARNGVDVLIRFRCEEPEWRISTTTLVQAKKVEPSKPMGLADHDRLTAQLKKMLAYTTEAFVLIYSKDLGVQVVPAVAAHALSSRQLFDLATISWPWFLSGVFRGRMGEVAAVRAPEDGWGPMWELDVTAVAIREEPASARMTAGG